MKELSGKRFGRWFVLSEAKRRDKYTRVWIAVCDCGTKKEVLHKSLVGEKSKSCGCLQKERVSTHGLSRSKLYPVWTDMKQRCENKNSRIYIHYGGRGISVCDEWTKDFIAFYNDMSPTYKDGLYIDRIDNDGNYELSNCRWVTPLKSIVNRRKRTGLSSQYRGVCWSERRGCWRAYVSMDKKMKEIGGFKKEIDAAIAYDNYILSNGIDRIRNFN